MIKPFNNDYGISQKFAENPASYAKFGLKGHNGIDYKCPTGTSILASHDGTVREVASDPTGYGLYVKIENNIEGSLYAHLKEQKVVVGQVVAQGQVIGISNNTGNSTGPHLHFGYYRMPRDRQNGYSGYVDPQPFFSQPTIEPMVTIPQRELDEIRTARDKHYNDLQIANQTIANLNTQITDKNRQIVDKQSQVSSLEERLLGKTQIITGLEDSLNDTQKKYEDSEKYLLQAFTVRDTLLLENENLRRSNAQLKRRIDEGKPKTFTEKLKFLFT